MASLICGSLAFDTIMDFEGRFAEQILPEQLHILIGIVLGIDRDGLKAIDAVDLRLRRIHIDQP